jgi:hypothetical protein
MALGEWGAPPPRTQILLAPPRSLFPLGIATTTDGGTVLVAVRIWVAPPQRGPDQSFRLSFVLDPNPTAILADGYMRQKIFLTLLPDFVICFLLALLGFALSGLWFVVRRRVFALYALLLLCSAAIEVFFDLANSGLSAVTGTQFGILFFLLMLTGSVCFVEFIWQAIALDNRPLKYLAFAGALIDSATVAIVWITLSREPVFAHLGLGEWGGWIRNGLEFGGALWGVAFRPGRRMLAAILTGATGVSIILPLLQIDSVRFGPIHLPVLSFTLLLTGCSVVAILTSSAWSTWRTGAEHRIQLEAAREVQERLVPVSPPSPPGFTLQAAYHPAAEVGGDFYQTIPQPDGEMLIVIGDVSGKGLKAAMTGALAIGSLRTLAAENLSPAAILHRLNRQIVEARQGGFITCLCALLETNGRFTLANAGHLSPYLNGVELICDNGLPLGLTADADYAETTYQMTLHQQLTLLTDGVLEARNAAGELFGFDRTRDISQKSAQQISEAAQQFGQEDDITVLTIAFTPGAALPA